MADNASSNKNGDETQLVKDCLVVIVVVSIFGARIRAAEIINIFFLITSIKRLPFNLSHFRLESK